MNANLELRSRKQFIWPGAGIVIGMLVAPFYKPQVTLEGGIAAWFADLTLVLVLSAHPMTARMACLVAGLFLAVPCLLDGSALSRGLLMCGMALPLAIAALPLLGPPTAGFRERLTYLFTWLSTREVKRRARSLNIASLLHLIAAVIVFAAAMAAVKAASVGGAWLLVRWLAGGIMILAFAEVVTASHNFVTALMGVTPPALMESPYLSTSLIEFWTRRWNPAASLLVFRTFFFRPLARCGAALALCAAFFASAVGHVLLPLMATGQWGISLMCGAFFAVQPLLIAAERAMKVRWWSVAAARTWTLTALAIASPLFVEPVLQIIEPDWGAPDDVLSPTMAMVGFVIGLNVFYSLGSLAARPRPVAQNNEASMAV